MRTFGARVQVTALFIGIGMLIAVILLYADNKRTKECLSNYIARDHAATEARIGPANAERAALLHIFDVSLQKPPNQAEVLKSIEDYRDLLHRNDDIRTKNPYPEVPEAC